MRLLIICLVNLSLTSAYAGEFVVKSDGEILFSPPGRDDPGTHYYMRPSGGPLTGYSVPTGGPAEVYHPFDGSSSQIVEPE